MEKTTRNTNNNVASPSIRAEIKEQVDTLFSNQRNLAVKLRSKSVKVSVKANGGSSALEWL
ncbi:hypothetical protein LPA49_13090 [Pseudoalteromonas sp. MB41]|uniref:hypothetical protein n=1 Tax=Pseudoalteromonas sp. MB41 TaxID=2896366 RepID=UPI001E5FEF2B|nr:hypothetical protein [Pseudoalteromonas sp. MB41]MCC9661488.1 hypothetical protein [Pseudoalteromonas sp. MB41]